MNAALQFDRFAIHAPTRQLLVDGAPVPLGARAFDLLLALIERRDRVVAKDELLDVVWPGVVVEENNLQVQVSTLRKLLGPQAIATVPGRGYRFVATLANAPAGPPAAPAMSSPTAAAPATQARGNVPLDPAPLLGRDSELDELEALVGAHRLVSIAGAGGIGKTRVALALAHRLRQRHADGVWWIELAALAEPRLVVDTIARTVGVGLASGRAPEEALGAALADADTLLVLDNCEHVLAAVSLAVDALLVHCPRVRIVATTQEPLRTRVEQLMRLGSLAVPDPQAEVSVDAASGASAVALFVARAQAVERQFRLTEDNVGAVVEICRRLDGIPLAIELAAARVPALGVEQLRQRLDDRFRLLTAGARTVLRRHQTLRAALEWSHALLDPDEAAVFRRLGVCAGGCTLEMAQALCSDATLDEWQVLDALSRLVDKSLVIAEGGDRPRYRLLETPRAYALEQLAAHDETATLLRRHAQELLAQLRAMGGARVRVYSRDRPRFSAELDNLRAALDWAAGDRGDLPLALALLGEARNVWMGATVQAEGLRRARALVARLPEDLPAAARAQFWLGFASCGVFSTDPECFEAARVAADLWRSLGEAEPLYESLIVRAAIGGRRRDFPAAEAALAEARQIERPDWPPQARTYLAFAHWIVALNAGRYAEARAHADRQAALCREAGDLRGALQGRANGAACDNLGGRPEAAIPVLREVIAALDAMGQGHANGHNNVNLGASLAKVGEFDAAFAALRIAYTQLRREGDHAIMLGILVRLNSARGHVATATRIAGYARAYWQRTGVNAEVLIANAEALLPPDLDANLAGQWRAEGAALTEDQVFQQALADAD